MLDQGLAVVEHTVYLDGGDVLSQCGELAFLDRTDLALGVEYIDVDAVDTKETVGDCRTRVTAGGDEHIDLSGTLLTDEILKEACHETGTDILECQGGTME